MQESLRVAVALGYVSVLALLSLLALHRLWLLVLLVATRKRPAATGTLFPRVTVQLPLYNEVGVAVRTLEALAALDYPAFEIQVLDDSTDETSAMVAAKVVELRARGIAVAHIQRSERTGFKAGALARGLEAATGELVAIFDADFVPAPDFLRKAVPPFEDPAVGLVQARWDHSNRNASLLTRLQAILLDGHFVVEQAARSRSGRPFKFNGTAGVWRKTAIEAAGGWSADTLTEDLDLSVRAQLASFRFVFLEDTSAEGELPEDLAAYRSQQRRWVKGSAETARKLLGRVLTARGFPLEARLETAVQLVLNAAYPLVFALALLTVPLLGLGAPRSLPLLARVPGWLFLAATLNVGAFLVGSQWRRGGGAVLLALVLLPAVFALGLGLSISNARAFVEGLLGRASPFVRTPKRGSLEKGRYTAPARLGEALAEVLMAAYLSVGAGLAILGHRPIALPLQALLILAFLGVGLKTLTSSIKSKMSVTNSLT
jgi:cellulose synthase/poly-beta-1,6-N-acetylglucosamine synthase-like glycosyltransferase